MVMVPVGQDKLFSQASSLFFQRCHDPHYREQLQSFLRSDMEKYLRAWLVGKAFLMHSEILTPNLMKKEITRLLNFIVYYLSIKHIEVYHGSFPGSTLEKIRSLGPTIDKAYGIQELSTFLHWMFLDFYRWRLRSDLCNGQFEPLHLTSRELTRMLSYRQVIDELFKRL